MRWKALQVLGKLDTNNKQTFGSRSPKCPPTVDELGSFETDLQEMISNIKFRPIRNKFLSKLNEDVKTIKNTNELLINVDKSSNIYKMTKEDYKKHLENNISKTYQKSNRNKIKTINHDAKKIAKKLEIDDRVEKLQEAEALITIKDHKDGFPYTLSFLLINPSKADIVKIRKSLLDTINKNILKESKFNQWKNTSEVITWFKNINNKKKTSFINFDVENFYPSISVELFTEAINYAKTITNIDNDQLSIIMQSKKKHYYFITMNLGLKKQETKISMSQWVVTMARNCVKRLGYIC